MQPLVIDIDDFHEENHRLDLLLRIKRELPKFKATLFVIPALCSLRFLREMREYTWLDLYAHGWRHTDRECEDWTGYEMVSYMSIYDDMGLKGAFKAPGWRLSDGAYAAILSMKWWLADHLDHNAKRPEGLRTYLLDDPRKMHFHVQDNVFHNGLEESLDMILALDKDRDFEFCRNEIKVWKK
jgi:hypothetical protein